MLVGVRILLLRARSAAAAGAARAHSVLGARALRHRGGDRGAAVVRLLHRPRSVGCVPVHPGRRSSTSKRARCATARCSSASPASCSMTPFFYSQSLFAALAALPAVLLVGVSLDVLTSRRARGCAAVHRARGAAAQRRDDAAGPADRGAAVRAVSAPRRAAVGLAGRLRRPDPACPIRCRPGRSATCRCPTRSRFASSSTGRRRRNRDRYWRGPVFSRFDGATWCAGAAGLARRRNCRSRDAAISYTVTLEPNYRRSLFALDMPAARADAGVGVRDATRVLDARITRDQQILMARAGRATAAVHAAFGAAVDAIPPRQPRTQTRQPRTAARAIRARCSSRASCARPHPDDRALHRRGASPSSTTSRTSTRSRRRCSSATRSTCSCSTSGAASASTTRARSC